MNVHLPAIPHTVTRADFSHCAFTQKVRNFGPMLRARGYTVIHYGVEGSESGASEDVELMTTAEHLAALGLSAYHERPTEMIGTHANNGNDCYRQFNFALRAALQERLVPGDVVCVPFQHAHDAAWRDLPLITSGEVVAIETGIGYPQPATNVRVYESNAWRHRILGAEARDGYPFESTRLEWVVPNYFDLREWPVITDPPAEAANRIVYLGRIEEVKGLAIIPRLAAARPDLEFVLCGQGDPTPYLTERNVRYLPPIAGAQRVEYLAHARAALFPSRFIEPFCGAAVEAMLVGTPVITSDFGAFTETVTMARGLRCRTWQNWLDALDNIEDWSRPLVAASARMQYDREIVGLDYQQVFTDLAQEMARGTFHRRQ